MGVASDFVEACAKHKLLIYFAIFWGVSMFFWSLYDVGYYAYEGEALPALSDLFELLAGIFLVLFGIKFLKPTLLIAIKQEKALVYFLILWAASFFICGLADLLYYGQWIFEYPEDLLAFLGALADFVSGAVLALFGWNLLRES